MCEKNMVGLGCVLKFFERLSTPFDGSPGTARKSCIICFNSRRFNIRSTTTFIYKMTIPCHTNQQKRNGFSRRTLNLDSKRGSNEFLQTNHIMRMPNLLRRPG